MLALAQVISQLLLLFFVSEFCLKLSKIVIIGVVVFNDRKCYELELVLKFFFFHHFMEKSSDFCRRVMEDTAAESAEYESIMSMEKAYAEDCADLTSCNVDGDLRHVTFFSEFYWIIAVKIQGCTGYHSHVIWILHHRAVDSLTKNCDAR